MRGDAARAQREQQTYRAHVAWALGRYGTAHLNLQHAKALAAVQRKPVDAGRRRSLDDAIEAAAGQYAALIGEDIGAQVVRDDLAEVSKAAVRVATRRCKAVGK